MLLEPTSALRFDVTSTAIYFYRPASAAAPRGALYRFDLGTEQADKLVEWEEDLAPGISVSRDEQWLLFSKVDMAGSDLMLLEGFR